MQVAIGSAVISVQPVIESIVQVGHSLFKVHSALYGG
jgi:hypothetical protein